MERIQVDFSVQQGVIKNMDAVNNGPVGGNVRIPGKSNFDLYKEAGFSYARNHDASFCHAYGGEHSVDVHRIFKNFDADENDPANYIFEPTDKYLLNTVAAGTKIFYRLGASIEHGFKYGTRVPKDFAKWARICEHIIRHYNEGWANGYELGIEYWEIWNEPDCRNADGSNPCWQGTEEEFVELYCVAGKYLKEKFPHLKIGGPAFCWGLIEDFKKKFLTGVKESGAPLDFYSYHCYARDLNWMGEVMQEVRNYLDEYGFTETETNLNEWNYVKGWMNEDWEYTIAAEQGLKGASYAAGAMMIGQNAPLDMLLYYYARPCAMSGLFGDDYKTRKTYYSYWMFHKLKELGAYVPTKRECNDIFSCAATNGENHAIMLTYFDNDAKGLLDLAFELRSRSNGTKSIQECCNDVRAYSKVESNGLTAPKDVCIEVAGSGGLAKVSYYCLDDDMNGQLVREEIVNGDSYKLYLKLGLFSTVLVQIEKIEA